MTYSLESAFVHAYAATAAAVQNVLDVFARAERITRPPQRPNHDVDEPLTDDPLTDELRAAGWEFTPISEPPLTSDELVGVRGLLQERYEPPYTVVIGGAPFNTGPNPSCLHHAPIWATARDHACYCARPQGHPLDDYGYRPHVCRCGSLWSDLPKSSASDHTGADTEPAESVAEYMARAERVEGGYVIHDPHCVGCPKADDVDCPDLCVLKQRPPGSATFSPAPSAAGDDPAGVDSFPPSPPAGIPLATWLEPAVQTVLAEHFPQPDGTGGAQCFGGEICPTWHDAQEWCAHVAPLISAHLAQALPDYPAEDSVSIADLRKAADLIGSAMTRPADPRDYDYAALAERLSAAANQRILSRRFMETGQDMGASFAAEFFPQHRKPSK